MTIMSRSDFYRKALVVRLSRSVKTGKSPTFRPSGLRPAASVKRQARFSMNIHTPFADPYDAIVVGSGISGGWAAKELTEKGLKTLVLERGRMVEHVTDYPTAMTPGWEMPHRGASTVADRQAAPIQSKVYNYHEGSKHFFVRDEEHPYQQA